MIKSFTGAYGRCLTMRNACKLAALSLMLASSQVAAEEPDEPGTCHFEASWGDIDARQPTTLLVRQSQEQFDNNDSVAVAFFNDDWSIVQNQKLGTIKVTNTDGGWFENEGVAMEHGFVIFATFKNVSFVFDDYPAAMSITRQNKVIDRLRMTSLSLDWSNFKSCRLKKVAVKEEIARKERLSREIPKDPFAK